MISEKILLINQIITDFEALSGDIDDTHDNELKRIGGKINKLKELLDKEMEEAEKEDRETIEKEAEENDPPEGVEEQ